MEGFFSRLLLLLDLARLSVSPRLRIARPESSASPGPLPSTLFPLLSTAGASPPCEPGAPLPMAWSAAERMVAGFGRFSPNASVRGESGTAVSSNRS